MTSIAKKSTSVLLTEKPGKLFLQYLFPSVAATMMVALNYFVDTLCVGQKLGELGIAALNVSQPTPGVLYGLGYLLGVGGSTLYSAYMGKGEEQKARTVYTTCLAALVVISVALGVLGVVFLGSVTTFMGGVGSLQQGVREYLLYVFLFAPFFGVETFMVTFVRNDNAPRISMAATLCGCSLNIVLDVLFLFGFGWGIWSASLATALAVVLSSCILLGSTFRKKSGLKLLRRGYSFRALYDAGKLGLPSFLSEITASVVTLAFNSVLLRISGETAVAVYGIIASMTIIVSSGLAGVSNAMQPLVSINSGAGKQARVNSFLKMAVVSSFFVALLFTLIGELWPESLIRIFMSPDQAFLSVAAPGVRIVFLSYLVIAANVLIGVYFQSVQAPGEALTLTLLRGAVFPVMTVMGFAIFMGVTGVWVSAIVAEVMALLLAMWLYTRVAMRLRERNYASLQFFGNGRAPQNIESIFSELGADDLSTFVELIEECNRADEKNEGIPAFIGLDDLTRDYEGDYQPAYDDEDMGLLLAVGALLFTDLYEQNDQYMREKKLDEAYPAAAPAMAALARKCFRFRYDEEHDENTIIPYLGYSDDEQKTEE
ncbi:MAG: MATE family efflux transporter [Candidatus Limiplasma sp.]|nr:MATE family efflux transporter [Candidatus Limiplasma sp.]